MTNHADSASKARQYTVGVMKTSVSGAGSGFAELVDAATLRLERTLRHEALQLHLKVMELTGPPLVPAEGVYAPLDFLQIGVTEKVERNVDFLLVVTDVDLGVTGRAYGLTFPSPLVNVGVVSARRLSPSFRGEAHDESLTARRLAGLLLHTLGHLLNLPPARDENNVMFAFQDIADLERMHELTPGQIARVARTLPYEARDESTQRYPLVFTVTQLARNAGSILLAVRRANPAAMAVAVPSMFTTALSVDLVFFFTAEIWDVASTVDMFDLLLFSAVTVAVSVWVLYQGFALNPTGAQRRLLTRSMVVARASVLLALALTMLVFYTLFGLLALFGAATIFPAALMETWPTADPATGPIEHLKLALFLGAVGALTGVLGATGSRGELVRRVLFVSRSRP